MEETRKFVDVWDDNIIVNSFKTLSKIAKSPRQQELHGVNLSNVKCDKIKNHNFCPGDYVRATFSDGIDYEAKVLSVCGETCTISYIGYNNEEQVHLSKLVPSWGKRARRMQFQNCKNLKKESENFEKGKHIHQSKTKKEGERFWIPPPPPIPPTLTVLQDNSEELFSMLMAWYMSGYYTGIYHGLKNSKKLK